MALNEETKETAFFECKWSRVSQKDAERIIADLMRKAARLKWHNNRRKEYYGIIARGIENKKALRKKGYLAFDLEDFQEIFHLKKFPRKYISYQLFQASLPSPGCC